MVDEAALSRLLADEYAIHAACMMPVEGGTSAQAYRAEDARGAYFLKVYDKARAMTAKCTANLAEQLCLLAYLARETPLAGSVCGPVFTRGGAPFCEDAAHVYVLFEFIQAKAIGFGNPLTDSQAHRLGVLVRALHAVKTPPVDLSCFQERFELDFLDAFEAMLKHGLADAPQAVREQVLPRSAALLCAMDEARRRAEKLKTEKPQFVLCHTDLHGGNMLARGDRLWLIDWENALLAPKEADLFLLQGEPHYAAFLEGYGADCPVDNAAMDFYSIRRSLDDIWEFLRSLVCEGGGEDTLRYLKNELAKYDA